MEELMKFFKCALNVSLLFELDGILDYVLR